MTTENNNQNISSPENASGKFTIDLIPIENKEDKYAPLSNLAILTWFEKSTNINGKFRELWFSVDNINSIMLQDYNSFWYMKQEFAKFWYSRAYTKVNQIWSSGCLLFKVQEVSIVWDQLILKTTDDMFFVGKIEDYLQKGLLALTKRTPWEIQVIKATTLQKNKYSLDWWLLNIRSKQLLSIWADDYCETREGGKELCILKDNKIALYTYDDDSVDRQSDYFDLSVYGDIKNIRTDSNNNFYFIICEKEGVSVLKVLNRKTLEEVMTFSNLNKIVYLSDEIGRLYCMDTSGYLRIVTINTKNLERWYVDTHAINAETTASTVIKIEDKPRSELKSVLSAWGILLTPSTEAGDHTSDEQGTLDDSMLRQQLRQTPIDGLAGKTLHTLYTESETQAEIDLVYQLAQQLKNNPQIIAVKGLIDPIITAISTKRDNIRLVAIGTQLQAIAEDIAETSDFAWLVAIKQQLSACKQTRSQILATNKELDVLLRETIAVIDTKIQEYQAEHHEELNQDIQANCDLIREYMEGIDYLPQLTSIYSTDLWKSTETMLTYTDETQRDQWKKKMSSLVSARQHQLANEQQLVKKSHQHEQEKIIEQIRANFVILKGIIESIQDESTLKTMELSDPLVLDIKQHIDTLPSNKSDELTQRLEQLFKERQLSIQFSKETTWSSFKTLDQYGIPKSLYFVPDINKKVVRDIAWKPLNNSQYKLQFVSSTGSIIEPSINKKMLGNFKFTYTFEEWLELKKTIAERKTNGAKTKYRDLKKNPKTNKEDLAALEKKYYVPRMLETMNAITGEGNYRNLQTRKYLPEIDNKTVITETIQDSLKKRGRILSQQLQYKQGIMIVESEAGTGKNFKCDILGHLTNREVFDVSCNEYMEKEDLLFSPEIDNEGTHRQPSKLVQGLQTPGAIIVLDEINTLKPGVSKLLNPLLDGRRYINDPQMGRIYAHPSVVIIGLMNPRYYRGTKDLPQEFVSRARITWDKYPKMQEEAYMISKYLDGTLNKLSQEEFNNYRDEYINKWVVPSNKSVYNLFISLHKTVKVAAKIREIYSETMKGNGNIWQELNFVFTIRDGNYIIQDFNHTKDILESTKDVILAKIADADQKDYAQSLIESVCK